MSKFYGRLFANRAVLSFLIVMMLLLSCVLRIAVIATSDYSTIQASQSSYRITISRLRGTIYDCNMVPITNSTSKTLAAISPTPKGIMAITTALDGQVPDEVLDNLKKNKPATCTVEKDITSEGIATTVVYNHTNDNSLACHIIGYTDSTGHGVSGIEKAYDDLLYSEKTVSAVFSADGKGKILEGIDPYFDNDLSVVHGGVVTTIDVNIQSVVENALSNLQSGCVVVAEVGSGKIRAMASAPTFDVNRIAESLDGSNSPMLNRALSAFNVGSVFKPIVAAAAIENGYMYHSFNCVGKTEIVDRVFRCHKLEGHGDMNLCTALSQSCNCYFYDIALKLGGDVIYRKASILSIGNKIRIADNLYSAECNMTDRKTLESDGLLANFSIGQGDLTASPVAMLNLYGAIAADGCYRLPTIVEKTIKDGTVKLSDTQYPTRVMSEDTAAILREYLTTVITEGTGTQAAPKLTDAAGKTATAQTGRFYENGEEITNSWFCGFFPTAAPKYVVVIMSDGRLSTSTASVFAEIADGITALFSENLKNGY